MDKEQRLNGAVMPLLEWYHDNARSLPWRSEPTPYRVWISEIMLQQTRVAAVLDYFRRFTEALPDTAALAACPEDRLMKLWQGLGYYSRARNLQKAAKVIEETYGGRFPADYASIRALPGVGDYTAGAISSIAFGLPHPAVDGNVLRVVTRWLAVESDITKQSTKKEITRLLSAVMPLNAPGQFNQALMELGATVCLPNGAPLCERCPAAGLCLAAQKELTHRIPVKPAKKPRRVEKRRVFLIVRDGKIALRRRPSKGLLAGLWELPNEEGTELPLEKWGIRPERMEDGGRAKHIFSHIEWHMTGFVVHTQTEELPAGWVWADGEELRETYPVPNAFEGFREQAALLTAHPADHKKE